jgi:RNA polymerase sigma factor for flagellar operon FliA
MISDELAKSCRKLVDYHANRLSCFLIPPWNNADLRSAGRLGLVKASMAFDESRGVRFQTYAHLRIRGAMLDFLREVSPAKRKQLPILVENMEPIDQAELQAKPEMKWDHETDEHWNSLMSGLTNMEKRVVFNRVVAGKTQAETSRELGRSEAGIHLIFDKAKAKLRESLAYLSN